ncbi:hypothetical protein BY996DRAFT_6569232 [Phakopsora pachyrhizi]|nr:hypothetical protein BY996DRAFT_6569232 [Phakopsora pachyrhizi]
MSLLPLELAQVRSMVASGFLLANLPRLEEEWIKISDLNGRIERLMVVAVLGFALVAADQPSPKREQLMTAPGGKQEGKEFIPITTSDPNLNQGLTLRREICSSESPILMGVWGMLSSILDAQTATMGLEKCQERDFELVVQLLETSNQAIERSNRKLRTIGSGDVESTGQGDLIGAAGSIKSEIESQTKETKDLLNQKEDEFEDKKTLNRHMLLFGLPDQKGGPNKNWKSTTDGLKERMDGSDLHPTETSDDSKQEVVVEFDDEYGYGRKRLEMRRGHRTVLAQSGDWSATVDAHMGQTYVFGAYEGHGQGHHLRMGMMEEAQQQRTEEDSVN